MRGFQAPGAPRKTPSRAENASLRSPVLARSQGAPASLEMRPGRGGGDSAVLQGFGAPIGTLQNYVKFPGTNDCSETGSSDFCALERALTTAQKWGEFPISAIRARRAGGGQQACGARPRPSARAAFLVSRADAGLRARYAVCGAPRHPDSRCASHHGGRPKRHLSTSYPRQADSQG